MAKVVFTRTSLHYGDKVKTKKVKGRKNTTVDFLDRKESIINDKIAEIKTIPRIVQEITERGVQIAQFTLLNTLSNPNFTQKYGDEMVKWINVVKEGNTYKACVGFDANGNQCDESMFWNLYFAEYGAGKDKDGRVSGYPSQHQAKQPNGQWRYYYKGTYYETNTSIPARYFEACKRSIRSNVKSLKHAQKHHKKFEVK